MRGSVLSLHLKNRFTAFRYHFWYFYVVSGKANDAYTMQVIFNGCLSYAENVFCSTHEGSLLKFCCVGNHYSHITTSCNFLTLGHEKTAMLFRWKGGSLWPFRDCCPHISAFCGISTVLRLYVFEPQNNFLSHAFCIFGRISWNIFCLYRCNE